MKKFFLFVFIVVDLGIMGATAAFLYTHVTHRPLGAFSFPGSSTAVRPAPVIPPASVPVASVLPSTSTPAAMTAAAAGTLVPPRATTTLPGAASVVESGLSKILFTYRNSKSRQVSIRADFTGWKALPMDKDAKGVWTYQATLPPGEYAYCFTADDKTFKDPANKRTKQIGRTFVSAVVVKPKGPSTAH